MKMSPSPAQQMKNSCSNAILAIFERQPRDERNDDQPKDIRQKSDAMKITCPVLKNQSIYYKNDYLSM